MIAEQIRAHDSLGHAGIGPHERKGFPARGGLQYDDAERPFVKPIGFAREDQPAFPEQFSGKRNAAQRLRFPFPSIGFFLRCGAGLRI